MGNVVAFIEMAGADKYPIRSLGESPEYMGQVDSAGTHDANKPHFGGILQSGNSSQVRGPVCSPMAYKSQYFRFVLEACAHVSRLLAK